MFASDRDRTRTDAPDSPPTTAPLPAHSQDNENARRAKVLERRLNTPSTFADREAVAAQAPARQLVSMGMIEMVVHTGGIHGGRPEVREGELLFDRAHPNKRYIKLAGDSIAQPLFDSSPRLEEQPVPLPPLRSGRFARPSTSAYPPSQPDPPPRPA